MFLGVSSSRGYCCHKESHNDYNQARSASTHTFWREEAGNPDSTNLLLATHV